MAGVKPGRRVQARAVTGTDTSDQRLTDEDVRALLAHDDPRVVRLARWAEPLLLDARRSASASDGAGWERPSAPACQVCGRQFGAARGRARMPVHGPRDARCPGSQVPIEGYDDY